MERYVKVSKRLGLSPIFSQYPKRPITPFPHACDPPAPIDLVLEVRFFSQREARGLVGLALSSRRCEITSTDPRNSSLRQENRPLGVFEAHFSPISSHLLCRNGFVRVQSRAISVKYRIGKVLEMNNMAQSPMITWRKTCVLLCPFTGCIVPQGPVSIFLAFPSALFQNDLWRC